MTLIYLSLAWLAGIFLGSKVSLLPLTIILTGLIPLPLLFILRHQKKIVILTSLCLLTLLAGAIYFRSRLPTINENSLQFYNDQGIVTLKGTIAKDPEVSDKTVRLTLSATELKAAGDEWYEVSGTALIFVPLYPVYAYGDTLQVTGRLETPPRFDDFNYQSYLAHQGIYSAMSYPKIDKVPPEGQGFKPLEWVYSLRNHLAQTLTKVLPEPQASLAQGITLGMRGSIPSSLNAAFSHTGTTHILAISGVNLTIVAGILLSLGVWLFGRRHHIHIWLTLGIIWLYALLTGLHPPVLRAAIMVSLFLIAEFLGRQRSATTALTFAAAIMVGVNPQTLWEASFQLSFLAMAGLIFIAPHLQARGRQAAAAILGEEGAAVSLANTVVDSFSVTLGAIIATWPVIAHYFGIVSLVGPVATLFALPALSGIITTGVLAGGLGLIAFPLAQVMAWPTWLFLSYLILVVQAFATLPLASLKMDTVSGQTITVYYTILAFALWLRSHWQQAGTLTMKAVNFTARLSKKWVLPSLMVPAILVWVTAASMPDDELHVSFLNVGEGDAILIQQGSQQILIDGGPSPQAISLGLGQKMPFWDRTIELMVLTHPHADHLTGAVEVLQRYRVKQVLYANLKDESPVYEAWRQLIEEQGIPSTVAQAGQQINLGDNAVIKVLNPQNSKLAGTESDTDNNGIVLRLSLDKVSFLFTADTMWPAEFELITRRADLRSTVLKVAHHGSDTSTTSDFLTVISPQLAVISVGKDNRLGHPSPEVIARLKERLGTENIYRTDEQGTIEFITDGEKLWVKVGK